MTNPFPNPDLLVCQTCGCPDVAVSGSTMLCPACGVATGTAPALAARGLRAQDGAPGPEGEGADAADPGAGHGT